MIIHVDGRHVYLDVGPRPRSEQRPPHGTGIVFGVLVSVPLWMLIVGAWLVWG